MTNLNLGSPDMTPEDFRQVLVDLLDSKQFTLRSLSQVLGIGCSTLSSWTGRSGVKSHLPPFHRIPRLVERLIALHHQSGGLDLSKYYNVPLASMNIPSTEIADAYLTSLQIRRTKLRDHMNGLNAEIIKAQDRMKDLVDEVGLTTDLLGTLNDLISAVELLEGKTSEEE